ncbi:helix-turn-helix domain-containing protein [Enterococcus faecium]|uniref:helix-turn-helix domain-containing protein n=1 Tax=Enterococcus faecium TaxID=1352 RepID=UPI0022A85CA9|nr:AraC family transcriptional regulator [Enterococcus faecium]
MSSSHSFKGLIFETLSYDQDNLVSELSRQKQVYKFLELLLNSASYLNEGIITKKMNPFVRQTIEIIRENAYQKLSVKDIAVSLSIHENYLSRLFKNDMGISIKEYISEIKISIANDLLSSTEYSIQQISDKIGFSTVQSFSKAFKKANGVSPGVYRKRRLGLGIINGE